MNARTYQLRIQNNTPEVLAIAGVELLNAQWKAWTLVAGQRLSAGTSATCAIEPRLPPGSTQPVSWSCRLRVSTAVVEPAQESFTVHFGRWVHPHLSDMQMNFVGDWGGWDRIAVGDPAVDAGGFAARFQVHARQRFGPTGSVACAVVDVVPAWAPRDVPRWVRRSVMETRPVADLGVP